MSHFAFLRQRIKVIQTIRTTTSAMRLIAMSLQSRLRKKETTFKAYTEALETIQHKLHASTIPARDAKEQPTAQPAPPIIILIAATKGLCGSFNEQIFYFFKTKYALTPHDRTISIGTHATRFLQAHGVQPMHTFDHVSTANFIEVAHKIGALLKSYHNTEIILFSNRPRTLFLQKSEMHHLALPPALDFEAAPHFSEKQQLLHYTSELLVKAFLMRALLDSLLAEQAARFIAMNNATQNAEELLQKTKLEYSKARQAHVTRELLELNSEAT